MTQTVAALAEQTAELRAQAARIATSAGFGDQAANRLSHAGLAQFHRGTDSALGRYTETTRRAERAEGSLARALAAEAEAVRVPLTREQLAGAEYVRDRHGWHKVRKVNAKTVTVETEYSWTETIHHAKVVEVR